MPKSWSKKKKQEMDLQHHIQKPDIDNLCKAFLDANYSDDSHIHTIALVKRWAYQGMITVGYKRPQSNV